MIFIDSVKTFSEFLNMPKTYQPNPENGYIQLSDYKYLIAYQLRDKYQVFISNSIADYLDETPNGGQLHVINLLK